MRSIDPLGVVGLALLPGQVRDRCSRGPLPGFVVTASARHTPDRGWTPSSCTCLPELTNIFDAVRRVRQRAPLSLSPESDMFLRVGLQTG